jgi:hypothetical protein
MKGIRVNTVFTPEVGKRITEDAIKEGNSPTVIVRRIVTQHYKKVKGEI